MADTFPTRLACEYLIDPLGIDVMRPRLSWVPASSQQAYLVIVTDDQKAAWDSGWVTSAESVQVEYAGSALESTKHYEWKVRTRDQAGKESPWSKPAHWSMGLLGPGWASQPPGSGDRARWVGASIETPWNEMRSDAIPVLRKGFRVEGTIKRATVFASALGIHELRLNGKQVGDRVLAPEWTDYHKRLQYQTYDVTAQLVAGENVIGATLAPGWYAGRIGLAQFMIGGGRRGAYGRHLRLICELHIELSDGSKQVVRSDGSWKYTLDGPVRSADLLDGQVVDGRKALKGWDSSGYNDNAWQPVDSPEAGPRLVAQPCPPIRVTEDIRPKAIFEPNRGIYVFDLGQNFAGRCRLKVTGNAGDEVILRHAEVTNADRTIYRDNLRNPPVSGLGAPQEDRYTCAGTGEELFEPQFTYHGFRFVEVTGLKKPPKLDDLIGRVVHSDCPVTGSFECSSDLVNRIHKAVVWTLRSNLHGVPTDCPQRDERFGWTGDMEVFAPSACFNMDMSAFFTKWLRDIIDAQADDGRLPDFAPHPYDPNARFSGNPAWGDALPVIAWKMHEFYGDKRILDEVFEPCRRYVECIRLGNPDLLWKNRGNQFEYGDWLNGDTLKLEGWPTEGAKVPIDIFATAFFAHATDLLARMAHVLGRAEDEKHYTDVFASIRNAFNREYVASDGKIQGDTQAGYALALHFGLLPESLHGQATTHLAAAIERYHGHVSTGFHSTVRMMLELSRLGRSDLAYALINQTSIPSWGYMVQHDGTTIWERWDGFVEGRGFQDPGMNSFCHYAIGAVDEWLYRVVGGINPDPGSPGFKRFSIAPQPGGGFTFAKVGYDSIRGRIESNWSIDGNRFVLDAVVPPNCVAEIRLPDKTVREAGEGKHRLECRLASQ